MELLGDGGHDEDQDEEIEGVERPAKKAREHGVRGLGCGDRAHGLGGDAGRRHGVQ